jgi:outer membrane receptor protein involved in Fe transport
MWPVTHRPSSTIKFFYKILSVQAGVRYEVAGLDTQIVTTLPVFRAGLNVQAAKATFFRASWGQGFRIPSIAEKTLAANFTQGVVIIPNDTLKEERNWSMELGFRQGFMVKKWKLFFDAAFFWQQYKNYIEYQIGVYPNQFSNGQPIFPDSLEIFNDQVLGPKPFNLVNARIAGYELGLVSNGKIGPVGIQLLAGYTYTYPTRFGDTTKGNYSTGQFIKDMFKYNFQKADSEAGTHLLAYRLRHMVRADIELSYWKAYIGATFSYGSAPDVIPAFYQQIAGFIFNDGLALDKYLAKHKKGDFFIDLRAGIKVNENVSLGFIVKNVANRFYELRPGRAEPLRNFTLQFRYNF